METKRCPKCKKHLPLSNFNRKNIKTGTLQSWCKSCSRNAQKTPKYKQTTKEYYINHREEILKRQKERSKLISKEKKSEYQRKWKLNNKEKAKEVAKRYKNSLREKFINMYGNKCSCCGETHIEFLTIEHINGQAGIERNKKESGATAYKTAIQEYHPDLYDVLCWNCNCSKGRYGYCPHELE